MHAYKDQNYAKKTIKLIDGEHTCELCQFTLAKDQGKNIFLKKVFYFVKTLVCLLSGVCAAATALKQQSCAEMFVVYASTIHIMKNKC